MSTSLKEIRKRQIVVHDSVTRCGPRTNCQRELVKQRRTVSSASRFLSKIVGFLGILKLRARSMLVDTGREPKIRGGKEGNRNERGGRDLTISRQWRAETRNCRGIRSRSLRQSLISYLPPFVSARLASHDSANHPFLRVHRTPRYLNLCRDFAKMAVARWPPREPASFPERKRLSRAAAIIGANRPRYPLTLFFLILSFLSLSLFLSFSLCSRWYRNSRGITDSFYFLSRPSDFSLSSRPSGSPWRAKAALIVAANLFIV